MDRQRAAQMDRVIERFGLDLRVKDPRLQRIGRLERVQEAWLGSLEPRGQPPRTTPGPRPPRR
jgi:hypothetical protein